MSDTMLGRAFNAARSIAEDALERVEKRWDQAMDVIHARPIRDPTLDDALGGGEQFAAHARERLDYQLLHPGPGEIAERHADLAGDATVDRSQIDKIIRREVAQAKHTPISWEVVGNRQILPFVDGKENGTMDSEVKAAKEHVREREQERWTRVEQIGRQAIDSDRARVTEKPTVTTEADLATKAERQRPQTA